MEDTDNQMSSGNRIIIDLDALAGPLINRRAKEALATANQTASTALASLPAGLFQQIDRTHQLLSLHLEPLRRMAEVFHEVFQKMWEKMREAIDRLIQSIKPLTFVFTRQPIYLVQPRPVIEERSIDRYLSVEADPYDFFVIGGKQLSILHPKSSRPGKLLAFLLERRAEVIDYPTLRKEIGARHKGDLDKLFKDLKYQLRKQGIALDYARPRGYGIALKGLRQLQ